MLSASSALEKQHGENVETMKNTELAETASVDTDDMRDEYRFDYSKAKPNRFADEIGQDRLMIVLDPDVAVVFKTPESVNRVLRALIATMPDMQELEVSG
jgi:hypothetical protein